MIVDGQHLTNREVRDLVGMVRKDAQEYAGQFFDQCRSAKFRTAWTEVGLRAGRDAQLVFVEQQWTHFVEAVRALYVQLLTSPKVSDDDKAKIHKALLVQAILGQQSQAVPVQLAPGTQQFEGEKYENREIAKSFGTHAEPSLMAKLMGSTSQTRH